MLTFTHPELKAAVQVPESWNECTLAQMIHALQFMLSIPDAAESHDINFGILHALTGIAKEDFLLFSPESKYRIACALVFASAMPSGLPPREFKMGGRWFRLKVTDLTKVRFDDYIDCDFIVQRAEVQILSETHRLAAKLYDCDMLSDFNERALAMLDMPADYAWNVLSFFLTAAGRSNKDGATSLAPVAKIPLA